MIAAEIARGRFERALQLAREAAALDRGRSAEVLAFLEAQTGEPAAEDGVEPPSREQVDGALQAALREHRLAHAEDRRPEGEEPLG